MDLSAGLQFRRVLILNLCFTRWQDFIEQPRVIDVGDAVLSPSGSGRFGKHGRTANPSRVRLPDLSILRMVTAFRIALRIASLKVEEPSGGLDVNDASDRFDTRRPKQVVNGSDLVSCVVS